MRNTNNKKALGFISGIISMMIYCEIDDYYKYQEIRRQPKRLPAIAWEKAKDERSPSSKS